jgi:thiol:disulfide interchange protein DsbD
MIAAHQGKGFPFFWGILLLAVSLTVAQHAVAQAPAANASSQRIQLAASSDDDLLPPDQAFKFKVAPSGPDTLIATLEPAAGYYLYKEKVHFALRNSSGVLIKEVKLPPGEVKSDQFFGKMEVYKKPFEARIDLDRKGAGKSLTLLASYQGCHEKPDVCYPPVTKTVLIALP